MVTLPELRAALGGEIAGQQVVCPGPGHSRRDRSLAVRPSDASPLGFVAHSYAGDPWPEIRAHICDRLGIGPGFGPSRLDPTETASRRDAADREERRDRERRQQRALAIWREAVDPLGTLVETYLTGRAIDMTGVVGAPIRFHPACQFGGERVPAMVALMSSIRTGIPVAIHRTALSSTGEKIGRKMLGPTADAAVMLDEAVSELAVGEGIETGLSARQLGIRPTWAMGSVGAISRLPVLGSIHTLTLLEERDDNGASLRAVAACGVRWQAAGRAVHVIRPRVGSDLNDQLRSDAQ